MTTPEIIETSLSAIPALAAVIGLIVAVRGIDAWRREYTGKRRIDLAEDTLATFYEAADAIRAIRSPISYPAETESLEKLENETQEQFAARRQASVVFVRYEHNSELFGKLRSMRYRFMAQIGRKEAEPFDDIYKIVREILAAANSLSRLWARPYVGDGDREEQHQARIDKYEAIFWDGASEEDPIAPRLEQTIEAIEKSCRTIVEGALAKETSRRTSKT